MTGHKSAEMVRRYIKEANLFKNNALNKNQDLKNNSIIKTLKFTF